MVKMSDLAPWPAPRLRSMLERALFLAEKISSVRRDENITRSVMATMHADAKNVIRRAGKL
jgi:hypothetical protein